MALAARHPGLEGGAGIPVGYDALPLVLRQVLGVASLTAPPRTGYGVRLDLAAGWMPQGSAGSWLVGGALGVELR